MTSTTFPGVLRTRLVPQRIPIHALPRAQLVQRVRDGLGGRLVAVLAGAGYGKSTLLAQALAGLGGPWVWCSCDERIETPGALLAHLASGLSERVPGFGAGLVLDGPAAEQVTAFSNEIAATIAEDVVMALDDVHTLPPASAEALCLLVRDLPRNAHLVLASRSQLTFPVGRLRLGEAVEIAERELSLSPQELAELAEAIGARLAPDVAAQVHQRTEGWVAGAILAAQAAGAAPAPTALSDQPLFDYLAEEVLGRQTAATQEFLLRTSILERFTPALAQALTGDPHARRRSRDLVAQHLFTTPLGAEGEWYRYHQLLGAFLRRRLEEREGAGIAEIHRQAAAAWRAEGEPLEAVRHLLKAGDHADAVDVLEPIAEGLLSTAEAATLAGWLEAIPADVWAGRPSLLLANAWLLYHRGEYEPAFAALEDAIERLIDLGQHERAASAFFRLIYAQLSGGSPQQWGLDVGRRCLGLIDARTALLPAARVMMASEYGCACRYEEAEAELAAVMRLSSSAVSPLGQSYVAVVRAFFLDHPRGRSEAALSTLDWAIALLDRYEAHDQLSFVVAARVYRAMVLNHLGRFEEALAEADRSTEAAERRGVGRGIERIAAKVRALALAGLGRADELDALLRAGEPRAVLVGTAFAFRLGSAAALLAAQRGDPAAVRAEIEATRAGIGAYGFSFDVPMRLCDLVDAALAVGLGDLAREVHEEAAAAAERARTPWAAARAALLGAVAWEGEERADRLLDEALGLTERHGFTELWTRLQRRQAGGLLLRALARGMGAGDLPARLLAACGGEVLAHVLDDPLADDPTIRARLAEIAGTASDVDLQLVDRLLRDRDSAVRDAARRTWARVKARPRARITLITLGRFRILRDDVPVPDSAFPRQKARALLACLLASGGLLHREALCERLWPELAPERAAAALRTTLHELRRAVEPEVEVGSAASLIAADGDSIRLQMDARDRWDVAEFTRLAGAPRDGEGSSARIARLGAAEGLYAGPFLSEWPYEEWAIARRDELERLHEDVLEQLGAALLTSGDPASALVRYRRLVAFDPQREGWHRDLMRCYAAGGERALALRQYHACRAVLRREQGIEPGTETRALYEGLLRETVTAP